MAFRIATDAFQPGGTIPVNFTRDGVNRSPGLHWEELPEGTQSLAVVLEDPDAPGETFVHWLVYDIPPGIQKLVPELPRDAELSDGIKQGVNDFGELGFDGPEPPAGKRHQYVLRLYALSKPLGLPPGASKREVLDRLSGKDVIARSEITGLYKSLTRKKKAA